MTEAPKRARKHAEQTGHTVAVEQGINYHLTPSPPRINKR